MELIMKVQKSKPLKIFKNEMGQANHMLITTLIGLDGIIPYNVEKNQDFDAAWNPKDKSQSIERSKSFVKKSALSWLVDNIDMYFRLINQNPSIICDEEFKKRIDSGDISRSVYKRLNELCSFLDISSIEYALVDLLICWRNRLVHFQAENDIQEFNKKKLSENIEQIDNQFCHLNIERTFESFENKHTPTFKEVASFVKASLDLIYEIDKGLLARLDFVKYADSVIINHLKADNTAHQQTARLNDIFSKGSETAYKKLRQILLQNGFTDDGVSDSVDAFCIKISKFSFSEVKTKYQNKTFL